MLLNLLVISSDFNKFNFVHRSHMHEEYSSYKLDFWYTLDFWYNKSSWRADVRI